MEMERALTTASDHDDDKSISEWRQRQERQNTRYRYHKLLQKHAVMSSVSPINFFCDATLSQITRYSLHSVCLSVCPFVTFVILVTFQTYRQTSPPCTNSSVSVFSHQTLQRNSDGITVQGNIEYGWDIRKENRDL